MTTMHADSPPGGGPIAAAQRQLWRILAAAAALFFLAVLGALVYNAHALGGTRQLAGAATGSLLFAAGAVGAAAWRGSSRGYAAIVLALAAAVRIAWIWSVDTQPVSDFADMHTAALAAAHGDFSFSGSPYFTRWTYQIGFTLYEALLIKLFGSSLLVLKLMNVLQSVATAAVLYRIARKLWGELAGRVAMTGYALYVPNVIMCSVLTNQHVSTLLFALGCWLALNRGWSARLGWLWIGCCFAAGQLARPLGGFYLAGLIGYVLVFRLFPWRRGEGRKQLGRLAGVIAAYMLIVQAAGLLCMLTGVTATPLTSKEPYWKLALGLNPASGGMWSQADTDYALRYPLGESRNRAELALIRERLADPAAVGRLVVRKFAALWGAADAAPEWSISEPGRWTLRASLAAVERWQYGWMAVCGLAAALGLLLRSGRGRKTEPAFILLLLLGYVLLHAAIEIQTRYRFDVAPWLFLLQGGGVYTVWSYTRKRAEGRGFFHKISD